MSSGAAIVGGSLASGIMGSRAAKKAAAAQEAGAAASIAEQRRQFDIIQEQAAPYRRVGKEALYSLADMMGLRTDRPAVDDITDLEQQIAELERTQGTRAPGEARYVDALGREFTDYDEYITFGETADYGVGGIRPSRRGGGLGGIIDNTARINELKQQLAERRAIGEREPYEWTTSPGYQFRLAEGMKALERSQAGRRLGGRALKEAMRYGQEFGAGEFGTQYGRLAQLAGFGPPTIGAGMPTGIPGTMERAGTAQAQAGMMGAQSWSQALQGGLGNYMTAKYLDL